MLKVALQKGIDMRTCECQRAHKQIRIVLTGGPGAGKTAVLELIRQSFCSHVKVLPESAGIVFGGGFPRQGSLCSRRAAQRAIFYVQRELEETTLDGDAAVVLCDRGTVDGVAYWPGPDDFWKGLGTSESEQLIRYDSVIHMRTPQLQLGYNHVNPLRLESAAEANAIDERIAQAWKNHPKVVLVESTADFMDKVQHVIRLLSDAIPDCGCSLSFSASLPGDLLDSQLTAVST
jgi:predicted ATPase